MGVKSPRTIAYLKATGFKNPEDKRITAPQARKIGNLNRAKMRRQRGDKWCNEEIKKTSPFARVDGKGTWNQKIWDRELKKNPQAQVRARYRPKPKKKRTTKKKKTSTRRPKKRTTTKKSKGPYQQTLWGFKVKR